MLCYRNFLWFLRRVVFHFPPCSTGRICLIYYLSQNLSRRGFSHSCRRGWLSRIQRISCNAAMSIIYFLTAFWWCFFTTPDLWECHWMYNVRNSSWLLKLSFPRLGRSIHPVSQCSWRFINGLLFAVGLLSPRTNMWGDCSSSGLRWVSHFCRDGSLAFVVSSVYCKSAVRYYNGFFRSVNRWSSLNPLLSRILVTS